MTRPLSPSSPAGNRPHRHPVRWPAIGALALLVVIGATACSSPGANAGSGSTTTVTRTPASDPGRVTTTQPAATSRKVLVIRGADGTTGVDGGPNVNDLSDITSTAGKGLGNLTAMLAASGFDTTQVHETMTSAGSVAVDLTTVGLDGFDVVFFASNNASYSQASVQAFDTYIRGGGGALFTMDKNWGNTESAAADSDQQLLDPFGVAVGLDAGLGNEAGHTLRPGDATQDGHPILEGVDQIGGLGVTSFRQTAEVDGVTVTGLIPSKGEVVDNEPGATPRDATPDDFALLLIEAGGGRIVCHFDRDTFFNDPVIQPGNGTFSRNLFSWLAG